MDGEDEFKRLGLSLSRPAGGQVMVYDPFGSEFGRFPERTPRATIAVAWRLAESAFAAGRQAGRIHAFADLRRLIGAADEAAD